MLTGTVRQVYRLVSSTCSFFSRKKVESLLFGVFLPSAGPWPLLVTRCHAEDRILGTEDLLDRPGHLIQHGDRGERPPSALQPTPSLQPSHRSRAPCLTVLRLWRWCPRLSLARRCSAAFCMHTMRRGGARRRRFVSPGPPISLVSDAHDRTAVLVLRCA